jgi:hypothetical protein
MPGFGVARWRDGLCLSFTAYVHKEDALRELGIAEDELVAIAP